VHPIKPSYLLVATCLFLAAAGFLSAAAQENSHAGTVSSSTSSTSSISYPSSPSFTPSSPVTLDYGFFKGYVQPIFLRKRPRHARCFLCHSEIRSPMKLQPLLPGATAWNEEQTQKNFEAVKNVAIPGNLNSPILRHPLLTAAGGDFAHTGGKHFRSKDDPEWLTLWAFVMGAKVN
jgi:hypothetical protein